MIHIKTVKPKTTLAYSQRGFGPFLPDGSDPFDTLSVRSSYDSLQERPGIFGDNHVNHRELLSTMYLDPWFAGKSREADSVPCMITETSSKGKVSVVKGVMTRYMLAPSFPWRLTSFTNNRATFLRKISSLLIVQCGVTYSRSLLAMGDFVVSSITYTTATCERPKPGATSHTWRQDLAIKSKDFADYPVIKSLTAASIEAVLPRLAALAAGLRVTSVIEEVRTNYPCTPVEKPGLSQVTPRDVLIRLQHLPEAQYQLPDVKSYGEIAIDAISTLDTNSINMFEFLQGLKRPQDLVPKLRNLSKLKTHAGNYLGVQYGVLPLVSDFKTIYKILTDAAKPFFDPNGYQVLTAGHSVDRFSGINHVQVTNRVKICVNPANQALSTLSEKLRDIGGFPSINNLWELVPYSFVIDWFVNIGDMLEAVDARFRIERLPVVYSTVSSKVVITIPTPTTLTDVGASGDVSIVLYDRSVDDKAPTPPLNFEVSNELPNHWLEAGALIVTAKK